MVTNDNAGRGHESFYSPVLGRGEANFLVGVRDGGHVGTHDLKVRAYAHRVPGHGEHAQVQEGGRAEGAAADEDERRLALQGLPPPQLVRGEVVCLKGHA